MENFGSEIGQKMRSAVKAKLLELGTGGSAGYIDDELPDYVMIMVANKRSKQQMIADLNLFLGTQTDLFVTWLHEVLQKLQEVTLPAASVTTKKRKTSQKEETATKKEKKSGKKEKVKPSKKQSEETTATTPTDVPEKPTTTTGSSVVSVPVINSITDVFAEDLLEKAKKSLDVTTDAAAHVKKGKGKKAIDEESQTTEETTNEFDIPTISEISSTTGGGSGCATGSGNREKDLAELAEIQKKIYAAKKHLKHLGEFNDEDVESADEDFLNLKDDGSADEFNDAAGDSLDKPQKSGPSKAKSPIVFGTDEATSNQQNNADDSSRRRSLTPPPLATAAVRTENNNESSEIIEGDRRSSHVREAAPSRRSRERERREMPRKRPVHERLGMKPPQSREEHQREAPRERRIRHEKELYVPAFRRKELDGEKDRDLERHDREKGRERERERNRDRSAKPREREPRQRRSSPEQHTNPFAVDRHSSQTRRSSDADRKSAADSERSPSSQPVHRQRIGSRVIVAPAKQIEPSDEEDLNEKPVNSVIKIKPRPPVSPSKQACKNLLLRAVAEAQRSTILAKSKPKEAPAASKVRARLGEVVVAGSGERHSKLFTKSYRDRLKRTATSSSSDATAPPSALFRRTTQNLVIEVEAGLKRTTLCKRRRPNSVENEQPEGEEMDEEEYVPEPVSDQVESDLEYGYVAQAISNDSADDQSVEEPSDDEHIEAAEYVEEEEYEEDIEDKMTRAKTQFVVTMNDEKATKYKKRTHSVSPLPQVSSSSSAKRNNGVEASSTTSNNNNRAARSRDNHKHDVKSRVSLKSSSSLSPTTVARLSERESSNSSPYTPPQPRRSELIEIYRKPKDIKKIIIKNDSDDEEMSPKKNTLESRERKRHSGGSGATNEAAVERSTTPPLPPAATTKRSAAAAVECEEQKAKPVSPSHSPLKRKRTPIKFDLDKGLRGRDNDRDDNGLSALKRRSKSGDRERDRDRDRVREFSSERRSGEERRRITIRTAEPKKYDNIPSLSSVALDSTVMKVVKPKERCKYHPNCTKQFCEFYHPTAPCKSFPNCKFADKCMYSHPHCKYDMSCTNADCNFSHSGTRNPSMLVTTAPPLSSHVVPVQNYKSISAAPAAASTAMCKYYPNCQKVGCTFYHPKACRFGKNCINKLECSFYHHEIQSSSKFKWVAGLV